MVGVMTCSAYGLDAVDRAIEQWPKDVVGAVVAAVVDEMVGVMAVSKELCPVETGALRDSGAVSEPVVDGTGAFVILSYGGNGSVPYALIQHENLAYLHAAGKEAKFLERPLLEWANQGLVAIRAKVGA